MEKESARAFAPRNKDKKSQASNYIHAQKNQLKDFFESLDPPFRIGYLSAWGLGHFFSLGSKYDVIYRYTILNDYLITEMILR